MKIPAQQIGLRAKQVHAADSTAKFILLRLPSDAFDEDTVAVEAARWPVVRCSSPLAVRAAMRRHADSATPIVLLFAGSENELGADVLARCAKRRLFTHDVWQTVSALFRAAQIDPRLARHRWLAELLLQFMPAEGYAPVRSLALDEERAWKELFRVVLGFESYPPSVLELLQWAGDAQRRASLQRLEPAAREEIVQQLRRSLGDLVSLVVATIDAQRADDLLALVLLCQSLEKEDVSLVAIQAQVAARLEVLSGGLTLTSTLIAQLATAADDWFERASAAARERQLDRFESLVAQVKAEPLTVQARYGAAAFGEKLKRFAAALRESDWPGAQGWLQAVAAHRGPTLSEPRRVRCNMALRLLGWLTSTSGDYPASLSLLAGQYRTEIAWVDWAQTVLLEGDDSPELATAFARLRDAVRQRRDDFDRRFAERLRTDSPDGHTLIGVEQALDRCVAPAAAAGRILLLVIDGMSLSVFLELHHSLEAHGWRQYERAANPYPTLLAMLPSITAASRASLLSGKACAGPAAAERAAFRTHAALVKASVAGKPPLLFHKKDLLDSSGLTLTADLRAAMSDTRQRVVAVVINAVDDHLLKADQLRLRWDLDQFKGLDALLAEADSAGRTVIFTSDHGHILDQDTELGGSSPNARWRAPDPESHPGEIRLSGPRVKAASGLDEVILAWHVRLRYATRRNGYHGGCSPAEALVPIALYRYGSRAGGEWRVREEICPAWWPV